MIERFRRARRHPVQRVDLERYVVTRRFTPPEPMPGGDLTAEVRERFARGFTTVEVRHGFTNDVRYYVLVGDQT